MAILSGHYHDHWSWSPGPIPGMPESAVPITSVPIPMVNVRVIMTPIVMVITPMCLCARSHRQKDCRDCNQAQEKLFHNLMLSVSVTAGLRPLRHEIVVSTARATHVHVAFLQGRLCFWLLEAQELSLYWERASRNRDELVATKGKAGLTFADLAGTHFLNGRQGGQKRVPGPSYLSNRGAAALIIECSQGENHPRLRHSIART